MLGSSKKYCQLFLFVFLLSGCSTYKAKYKDDSKAVNVGPEKIITHTFYLIGDAGLSPKGEMNMALKSFKNRLDQATENSTAIFLGDNVYPAGLPDKKDSTLGYQEAKSYLDAQLGTLENFKGRPLFIPGNHDWYNEGLKGLKREEDYIEKRLKKKNSFLPENGCPISEIHINEKLTTLVIDTEWYLTNWDKHPTMNDECEIKSREKFWEEIEDIIKDNRDKTTLFVMHHPMFTYGLHGGEYSFRQHIFPANGNIPLPLLATFFNVLRRTSGASFEDTNNKRYIELQNRLVTLAQYSDKVIFASGHEHSLQFIIENNIPQIVSGAGAKKGVTRLLGGSKFAAGNMGYAILEIYSDGSSKVRFYGIEDKGPEDFLFTTEVLPPDRDTNENIFSNNFPNHVTASIYTDKEIDKSALFKSIWGKRYRKYYGTKITAPTVRLDTLFGGLVPVSKGGGHQSKSLRLRDKNGKEYVMRALRKVSEVYLQSMLFQKQYVMDDLQDTFLQKFMQDFYTGAHPYAPFTISDLSDAIGIYHTNPVLYYVPKQRALEHFNNDFGDELYMIEEHAGDGHGDLASFGFSNELKSTDAMLQNLRDDEKYEVDFKMYLRARLFDMVIGDWDRHVDQWRWAEFKDKASKKTIYRPVPRDRDQAYSIMGDGLFMGIATRIIPQLRLMEGFKEKIRSVEGFNSSPKTYVLDKALLDETTLPDWLEQAKIIQENLTPEVIDKAFQSFPEEVRDETIANIKRILLSRAKNIQKTAKEYYRILSKFIVVAGTDKDDWFEIIYHKNHIEVGAYRIIDGKKSKRFFYKSINEKETKELWVYGLDDEDRFVVNGNNKSRIKVRLIGGQNNDTYNVSEGNGTYIYDYKSKKNTLADVSKAKVRLSDDYELNTYQPLKLRNSFNQILPLIGFNPDDGMKVGITNTYTYNGFRQNPFSDQQNFSASYYFATNGLELDYRGEFANIFGNTNFEMAGKFTTPNFAINFFDFGNETVNQDDALEMDYNRVRLETLSIIPSLVWRGQLGSKVRVGVSYEFIEVEETTDRFISTFYLANGDENKSSFLGFNGAYFYENMDNPAFPTMGMAIDLEGGYKSNLSVSGKSFAYVTPSLSIDYKLISSGKLVLATKWKAQFNIGDGYEFYQAASIGGIDGLRGFRNQRFAGKTSYYQNTDIRYSLGRRRTSILPVAFGFYGGFDYGRIWQPNEVSDVWHTSYGGGFFLNASDLITVKTSLFNSVEGLRFSFGLGFGF